MPESTKFNPDDLEAVHQEAIEEHRWDADAIYENHREAADDVRFLKGGKGQWDDTDYADRQGRGAPCLTNSPLHVFVGRVTGSMLLNRPAIKAVPVDGDSDPVTAQTQDGIISNIEYQSKAPSIYKQVIKGQVGHGFGYAKVGTKFTGIKTFDQDIVIERIKDSFSVIPDRNAQDPTLSDADRCFIQQWTPRKQFKADYPDEDPISFESATRLYPSYHFSRWFKQDEIMLAEYYRRVEKKVTVVLLSDGSVVSKEDLQNNPELLGEVGDFTVDDEREAITHEVYRYILNGEKVIDGPTQIMSTDIPVPRAAGRTLEVDGYTVLQGLIRHAKDAMTMANYWLSTMAESLTNMPKAPWVGTAKMFEDYKDYWQNSSRVNYAFLPYTPDPDAPGGKPERQAPPFMPDAAFTQYRLMTEDIQNTTGLQEASLGIQGNEKSGVAIDARDRQADIQTFEFVDNFNDFLAQVGRVILQMIPNVYDTRRIIRILNPDGTTTEAILNDRKRDPQDPFNVLTDNDLSKGKYDIRIEVGPSFTTKRQETARQMLEIMKLLNPAQQAALAPSLVNSLDVVGKDEMVSVLKKLAPPGVIPPEEGEEPLPPPPPSPEQQLEAAKLQNEQVGLQNDAAKNQVDMAKVQLEFAKLGQEAEDEGVKMTEIARNAALDTIEEVGAA